MLHLGFSVSMIMFLFACSEAGMMHQILPGSSFQMYMAMCQGSHFVVNPLKARFAVNCDMPIVAASFEVD